jgi:hypothetical protein
VNQPKTSLFATPAYRPNRHHGLARRIATFLHVQADAQPRTMIPYPEIAQRVLGLKSRPGPHGKLTLAVRDELYRARDLLLSLFGRDLITNGSGARATLDADEMFRFRLGIDLLRMAQRLGRYGRTARLIRQKGVSEPRLVEHLRRAEAFALELAEPLRQLLGSYNALTDDSFGNRAPDAALAGDPLGNRALSDAFADDDADDDDSMGNGLADALRPLAA